MSAGASRPPPSLPGRRLPSWNPEDEGAWALWERKVAMRNLAISVPSLLCAFAVWMYWSIITAKMKDLGFPLTDAQRYGLIAVAGLAGATLRIPNSFLVGLAGGRNTVALTTGLLLLPAVGAGIALRDPNTPYSVFIALAALSGIGGGNFASSMSNISFFFPKRTQGLYLGINAGIGNLGVSAMQFGLPLAVSFGLFGALGGAPMLTPKAVGGSPAGTEVWLQNAGLVWIPILAGLSLWAWFRMDNLPAHGSGSTGACLAKVLWLHVLGFAGAAAGLWLLLGPSWEAILGKGRGYHAMWIALPVAVLVTLALLRYASPSATRVRIKEQYGILREKHTWVMTLLYIMTFGSFIGYANTLPNLIKDVFGFLPGLDAAGKPIPNASAPNALTYAWLGPLVGSLVRPVGGRLSDRFGGARVTQWSTVVMIASAIGVAWTIHQARTAPSPETWFAPFLGLILLLFVTTGVGNGSTFRMIPIIFPPAKAGPVLGWTSAIAAYGGFIIPKVFGAQIEAHQPEVALYGFAAFYVLCLAVNWWYYARRGAEVRC